MGDCDVRSAGREARSHLGEILCRYGAKCLAIATSGGMDSSCLVVAAMDRGLHPTIVTFTLEDRMSSDAQAAGRLAMAFGLPLIVVRLSRVLAEASLRQLLGFGVRGKAALECLWPFMEVFYQAWREFDVLATGSAADGHFGLSKKAMINHRFPKEKFDAFRREYFSNPDRAQVQTLSEIAGGIGKETVAPFFDPTLQELFGRFGWEDLNRPRQKEILRGAFPELEPLRIRRHTNLQLGDSGIAEHMSLTATTLAGFPRHRAVAAYHALGRRWSPRRPGGTNGPDDGRDDDLG